MVVLELNSLHGGAVAQLGARLDGIEEVVGSNPIGSTNFFIISYLRRVKWYWHRLRRQRMRTLFRRASRLLTSIAFP